jgi:hypothetical protein
MNNNYQKIHDSTSDELHPAPTEMHSTDVLFSPGSPATFPTSRIKASGFNDSIDLQREKVDAEI